MAVLVVPSELRNPPLFCPKQLPCEESSSSKIEERGHTHVLSGRGLSYSARDGAVGPGIPRMGVSAVRHSGVPRVVIPIPLMPWGAQSSASS